MKEAKRGVEPVGLKKLKRLPTTRTSGCDHMTRAPTIWSVKGGKGERAEGTHTGTHRERDEAALMPKKVRKEGGILVLGEGEQMAYSGGS